MNKKLKKVILRGYLSLLKNADMDINLIDEQQNAIKLLSNAIKQHKNISNETEMKIRNTLFNLYKHFEWKI